MQLDPRGVRFAATVTTIVLALDSPLDGAADKLFWAHMTQHVLLTMLAPPLLLLGRPWPRLVKPTRSPASAHDAPTWHG